MTGALVLVGLVLFLILEAVAIYKGWPTISRTTWRVIFKFPFVAFLLGYLMGHLTWPGEVCNLL